jgi:hypothetical protein
LTAVDVTIVERPARKLGSAGSSFAVRELPGAYYVAELTGVPFAAGAANIYRVVPGRALTVAWRGFTTVIHLAFGPRYTKRQSATNDALG